MVFGSARSIFVVLCAVTALGVAAVGGSGCAPKPPRGTPVDAPLMPAAEAPELPSKKEWYAWHQEGLRRLALGKKDEALFCFQRALDAWPQELPKEERGMRPPLVMEPMPIPEHRAVPLDTLLKLAELYIARNEPNWALHYLNEFDRAMPGKGHLTKSLRVQALALRAPIVKGTQTPKQAPAARTSAPSG
jgi:hypothetical protein